MTPSRPPPWTAVEDARLIHLRESGETGEEIYTAIPGRSSDRARRVVR